MAHPQRRDVEQPLLPGNDAPSSCRARTRVRAYKHMIRLRHTDELVGLLVVVAVMVFVGAMLEAGVLRDWFRPVSHLHVVLPQSGVGGLAIGADIEVLGIHAGTVRRIILNPNQEMYAEADIDQQADAFIRRDS